MNTTIRFYLTIIFAVLLSSIAVSAQSGGTFEIRQSVIASGGGQQSAGGAFSVDGTIGQPIAGTQSVNSPFTLQSGFWAFVFGNNGNVNTAPVADADNYGTEENTPLNVPAPGVLANDMDGENDSLTVILQTLPTNAAAFTFNPDGSFSYTPNANFNGSDSFTYTASDGSLSSNTATVTITVSSVNNNPAAMNDSATLTEDSGANAINVLENDSSLPDTGETLTVSAVTQGANGAVAVTNGGAAVSYTPNLNFNGMASFTYTTSDGNGGSDTAIVNVNVTPVNDPPTIGGAAITRQQTAPGAASLIAAVMDVDNTAGSLTVMTTSVPTGITVTGITNNNGTISATVAADCSAAVGANTVGLKVTDSGNEIGTANLTVNVTAETIPPVINPIANVTASLPPDSNAASIAVSFPLPTASDNCGGTVLVETNPVSGSQFNIGTTTVNVKATDQAGNMSFGSFIVTVRQQYSFSWFSYSGLLLSEQVLNQVTAGSNVPVRFSLSGYQGDPYSSPPVSRQISCSTFAPVGTAAVINRFAPDPYYSALYDFYQTTWQTQTSWRFTCRRLTLYLNDGTIKSLNFYFK